jgi:phosphoribosylaminoimidazolecarboxamide formyltransferase / IMP cyclohydrolase
VSDQPAAPASTPVRRALLSVSDKTGVVELARGLAELGVELVSTGGTARALSEAGLEVRAIDDLTGFPEMLDGRVKTLNSKLYAGLLAVRSDQAHLDAVAEHGIEWVDLVCVNLYPFEQTVASGAPDAEVIENIDIGGPTMLRAAAKNHAYAAVLTRPEQYGPVLEELRANDGRLAMETRIGLARAAYETTARYDAAISAWFARAEATPPRFARAYERAAELSYGENPHQRAAYYAQAGAPCHVLSGVEQLHGKQISYNNILDLAAARDLVAEFDRPACAIIKHNNACGAAVGDDAATAYGRAFACDPLSAFGGVIALNRPVDRAAAEAIAGQFVEVLIAPAFDGDALEVLTQKPNVRLLRDPEPWSPPPGAPELRFVAGGVLVQDRDEVVLDRASMEVATTREPDEREWADLLFAWQVCRHVKSNAIVLARDGATVGIGAGQMSRVDSVRIAVEKAQSSLEGAALASDAFFPFADGPQLAIDAGVRAIIQPGGSVRDEEVVAAADAAGVAMVLTKRRHFRH